MGLNRAPPASFTTLFHPVLTYNRDFSFSFHPPPRTTTTTFFLPTGILGLFRVWGCAGNGDCHTPLAKRQSSYRRSQHGLFVKIVMFHTCLYERDTQSCPNTHAHYLRLCLLTLCSPVQLQEACVATGRRFWLAEWAADPAQSVCAPHTPTQFTRQAKSKRGPWPTLFHPCTVCARGNDKLGVIGEGKQWVMRTAACSTASGWLEFIPDIILPQNVEKE